MRIFISAKVGTYLLHAHISVRQCLELVQIVLHLKPPSSGSSLTYEFILMPWGDWYSCCRDLLLTPLKRDQGHYITFQLLEASRPWVSVWIYQFKQSYPEAEQCRHKVLLVVATFYPPPKYFSRINLWLMLLGGHWQPWNSPHGTPGCLILLF